MDYNFERIPARKIRREKVIEELKKAAKTFNYVIFGFREFDKISDINSSTVKRTFGSWNKAISVLSDELKKEGLELKSKNKKKFTQKELFDEMEMIWNKIGQRPSRTEWEAADPKISLATYKRYFGGWANACLKFIEYKMGGSVLVENESQKLNLQDNTEQKIKTFKQEDTRTIPLGVRLKVLDRDNFRCVFCGRSPATDVGVQLHIDHIIPFSKGGKSTVDNLQTLCVDCNLGKSNKENIGLETSRQRKT